MSAKRRTHVVELNLFLTEYYSHHGTYLCGHALTELWHLPEGAERIWIELVEGDAPVTGGWPAEIIRCIGLVHSYGCFVGGWGNIASKRDVPEWAIGRNVQAVLYYEEPE